MNTSVEISYYPLHDEYVPPIRSFIDKLNTYKNLSIKTNGMSTQVFGQFQDVMDALAVEIRNAFAVPHSVFIIKIVNADLNTVE